ncbi:MAG: hypothetical protein MJ087_04530 [Lachnospiraceae bacterium]|nr:hypothetical protein [Lachnospiraceae bacterium]
MIIMILLGIAAVVDLKTRRIPLACNLGISMMWFVHKQWNDLFLAFGIMGGFYLCRLLLRGGVGMGDVFLTGAIFAGAGAKEAAMGLMAGLMLFMGAGIGALILGKGRNYTFPFAPFLFAGYVMMIIMKGVS